jgi:hypothetical protein
MVEITGLGATLTLSTSGVIGNVVSIGGWSGTLGKLDISHLATTAFKSYRPEDLAEPGEFNLKVQFDTKDTLPSLGVVETATVSFPKQASGSAAKGTLAGTGFLSQVGTPEMALNKIAEVDVKFTFNGKTGPAFTKEA